MDRIKSTLNNNAMSGHDPAFNVNHFLFERNCFLKEFTIDGKNCGNIINHYCAGYNINQRIMLMTLQREMGLISMKSETEIKQFGKYSSMSGACGCGIMDDGTVLFKYLGFENQIKGACATYRHWFDVFKPETAIEILDKDVKICMPENAITLALLKYTPHIAALRLSERVFYGFFPDFKS